MRSLYLSGKEIEETVKNHGIRLLKPPPEPVTSGRVTVAVFDNSQYQVIISHYKLQQCIEDLRQKAWYTIPVELLPESIKRVIQ